MPETTMTPHSATHISVTSGRTQDALSRAALDAQSQAPIVIMIHGYRYCPDVPEADPHRQILSPRPDPAGWKVKSWPQALDLRQGTTIGYGWSATGSIWQAYATAQTEGARLAQMITQIRSLSPERPINLVAHSLGARVALQAVPHLQAGDLRRIVLLNPAEFRAPARSCAQSQAGRAAEFFSVITRQNTAYDWMLRLAMPLAGVSLGRSGPDLPGWLDLRLDHAHVHRRLAQLGHGLAPTQRRVCHWSSYLRDGVWPLYRAILTRPELMPLPWLRDQVIPTRRGVSLATRRSA